MIDCRLYLMAPSKQERHHCHKGGALTEVRILVVCQQPCFLHLTKLCSRTTHPNLTLVGQLSRIYPFCLPPSASVSSTSLGFLLFPRSVHLFPTSGPLHLLFPPPRSLSPCSSQVHCPFLYCLTSHLYELREPHAPQVTLALHHLILTLYKVYRNMELSWSFSGWAVF